jgi:zinc/manganese transport system substrate-binding protein
MMKAIVLITILLITPRLVFADLKIFACEPEWAALAAEIGAKHVKANSATNALQDPHYIQARPSLIAKVRNADLIICSGGQLEIGWLPMLLQKGNNPSVMPGSNGYLEASQYVKRLDVASNTDRSQGDVHPQGNPHIQTYPHNILLVAEELTARLVLLDQNNAQSYQNGLLDFKNRWSAAILVWEERAVALDGKRVIAHHKSWVYLQDWLGLVEVATLEAVSGIPPTAGHLAGLLEQFSDGKGAEFIIRAPFQSEKPSAWLSTRTGIPAVMLPLSVGGSEQSDNLFSMFDDILNRLLSAQQ